MAAQSETGEEIPPIRLAYRMWLRGARGALTAIANASQMPGDDYLDSILARPGMYAGPSVQALELVLVNLLNFGPSFLVGTTIPVRFCARPTRLVLGTRLARVAHRQS